MSLRQRGYIVESVERETTHVGRVLKLDQKQANTLVGMFFGSSGHIAFEKKIKKKMPEIEAIMPVPELFRYLSAVFY